MFKINWASLIVGSKFIIFVLFYFIFVGSFSKYKPPGGLYLEGRFNGGFFALRVWEAYTWGGGVIFGILRYYTMDLFLFRYYKTKVQACIQPLH